MNLIQGSSDWLDLRKTKVTASDSPIILRASPWKKPEQLLQEKLGLLPEPYSSPAMLRGLELEEEARLAFEEMAQVRVFPSVMFHKEHDWMMASLDGLSIDGKSMVEIKCPGEKTFKEAEKGKIPKHYQIQMQHQMAVADLPSCYYFCYNGEKGILLELERDESVIFEIIEKGKIFYDCLVNRSPLPLEENDYLILSESETVDVAWQYVNIKRKMDALKKEEDKLRSLLIDRADDGNFVVADIDGAIVKFTRKNREGSIDWEKLCEDKKISDAVKEKYRKPQIGYYTTKVCR